MSTSTRQPDILEVIADLSNDEVFTPPRIASQVLDLLPADVWNNPNLKFLDPGTKTGVFLREITKRLMIGLADTIPDDTKRLEHILTNQVYGIAITELTALMSRRTLYCSKDAGGDHSAVTMQTESGNILQPVFEHPFVGGRCPECGASKDRFSLDENKENHAYAFIHTDGRKAVKEILSMHFDVVVGNPPYHMTGGGGGSNDTPLYHLFVDQAKALNPRFITMITPSRWMAGGRGLEEVRQATLADRRVAKIVDYPNAGDVFPGQDIKGGVSYFLWDSEHDGLCDVTLIRDATPIGPVSRDLNEFDIFVRDERAISILHKALKAKEQSFESIVSGDTPFGIASNFTKYKTTKSAKSVALHVNRHGQRTIGYIDRSEIKKNTSLIDHWQVLIPKAGSDGGQRLPDVVLGRPLAAKPPSVCTQTYLAVGPFETEEAAASAESYIRTRFFRFLVSLRKISQDAYKSTYRWVPQQSWDRAWTDEALYKKYKITKDEQAYIAEMIKEMPAS